MKIECPVIHEDIVKLVKNKLPSDEVIWNMSEMLKIFGDYTRMKIIIALTNHELCVCDIASITNSTQSAISHQLRILKQSKLIKARKSGKVVYYSLSDNHVLDIIEIVREHINEN